MKTYTEDDLYAMSTQVYCLSCGTETDLIELDLTLDTEDDMDEAYERVACCQDPALEARIISENPLFDSEEANADALIAANPRLGRYHDVYQYHPGEDLLIQVNQESEDE